jgi:hypothetical protein
MENSSSTANWKADDAQKCASVVSSVTSASTTAIDMRRTVRCTNARFARTNSGTNRWDVLCRTSTGSQSKESSGVDGEYRTEN